MQLIDGRAIARKIELSVEQKIKLQSESPTLAVVWVGEDLASASYIKYKEKACSRVGINFWLEHLPGKTSAEKLVEVLMDLNKDPQIQGILLQLPLPDSLQKNCRQFLDLISPAKDVDGLNSVNLGKLLASDNLSDLEGVLLPATVWAVVKILESLPIDLLGKEVVIVGRGLLVGRPLSVLLGLYGATVTVCDEHTLNLAEKCRQAEILISATGQAGLITAEFIRAEAVVIDVGFSWVDGRVRGDVDTALLEDFPGWLTPVPGGVGPVTIACLLANVCQ